MKTHFLLSRVALFIDAKMYLDSHDVTLMRTISQYDKLFTNTLIPIYCVVIDSTQNERIKRRLLLAQPNHNAICYHI